MSSPGLSLFGFMEEVQAVRYLRNVEIAANPPLTDAALQGRWRVARRSLTPPPPNFGHPNIQPIPLAGANYLTLLRQQPWIAQALQSGPFIGAAFQYVEIDPLLAYQFHVDIDRSRFHCGSLSAPPTLDELLVLCLPSAPAQENIQISVQPKSAIIKSRSLNLQIQAQGMLSPANNVAGIAFALSLPLVHVTRFNGRCYLHNGYHRVYGAKLAGADYIPVILRDAATYQEAGIRDDDATFRLALLESNSPPTIRHFTNGSAQSVSLRALQRIITVSWADHVVPDE